ncbi:unnamed protein product, partial [Trichobilharzia szidati]
MNDLFQNNCTNINNLSNSSILWKPVVNWTISCFLIIVTCTIFIGNLLIIIAFATTSRLRRVTDHYIVSLAMADLLVSVLVLPLAIVRQNLGYWPFESHELCQFWLSANIVLCMASILNLCCISLDRFIAISRPIQYIRIRNHRTASAMIAVAWTLPMITMLPPLIGGNQHALGKGSCHLTNNKGYRIYSSIAAFYGPFLLIAYMYLRVFYVIKHRSKSFQYVNIKFSPSAIRKSNVATKPDLCVTFSSPNRRKSVKLKSLDNPVVTMKISNHSYIHTNPLDKIFPHHLINNKKINTCCSNHHLFRKTYNIECKTDYKKVLTDRIDSKLSIKSRDELEVISPEPTDPILSVMRTFHISPEHTSKDACSNCSTNPVFQIESKPNIQHVDSSYTIKVTEKTEHSERSSFCPPHVFSITSFKCHHHEESYCCRCDCCHQNQKHLEIVNRSEPCFNVGCNKRQQRRLNNLHSRRREHSIFHREQKTARILAAVVGCFTVCWFPFFTVLI